MDLTKPAGAWTYEDLLSLPDDGKRYEIIEGDLYEMPAPSWNHQLTIMNLLLLLAPLVQALGERLSHRHSMSISREPIRSIRIS
jgi:Uma2 family endonuclease